VRDCLARDSGVRDIIGSSLAVSFSKSIILILLVITRDNRVDSGL
jgi:hypothetical protein